ncbi:hypothetical protein PIROE2DRAFT_4375 [Piromyces sp. E2]|nr:hypothetical protein PIROE2DRAFT_4375 [Piromyces sp. E2]|eukprot:OUM68088.1 hypothetical protein PIROE2DRAFT_4375 [Piromyces sp. E2]
MGILSINLDLIKYLVHFGADIKNENDFGFTHIFNACESGILVLVKYLIKQVNCLLENGAECSVKHGVNINGKVNIKVGLLYIGYGKKGNKNIVKCYFKILIL